MRLYAADDLGALRLELSSVALMGLFLALMRSVNTGLESLVRTLRDAYIFQTAALVVF